MPGFSNLILLACLSTAWAATTCNNPRTVKINANKIVGKLRNLQSTNNAQVPNSNDFIDTFSDGTTQIADHWKEDAVEKVIIYTFPDVFLGFNKTGTAGDPSNNANYNWTLADQRVNLLYKRGVKASAQFQESNGMGSLSSPDILYQIGYMITDRYANGAHGSGFKNAIEVFDFYPEADLLNIPYQPAAYEAQFAMFAAFSRGVTKANSKVGCSAWGGNRIWTPSSKLNYTLFDPFTSEFFKYTKANNVPIKAASFHYTQAQYSLNPYEVIATTKQFRSILNSYGYSNLPIWLTEHNRNPSGFRPTSAGAVAWYDSPDSFSGYVLGMSMYGQDSAADQIFPWSGMGYGGIGGGNAFFEPWYNNVTGAPYNVAVAWKLQGSLVSQTPNRLSLEGTDKNGFVALAGKCNDGKKVQVLVNNYAINYQAVREITNALVPLLNTSTSATPLLQSNGLLNGEQACFTDIPGFLPFPFPICQTLVKPVYSPNTYDGYHLQLQLPWSSSGKYEVTISRVGGGKTSWTYKTWKGKGSSLDVTIPLPSNALDLVTITRC